MAWLWGFTVDDALISTRVAHQLATGHGYRFNPSGPIVDAVTPLGWAPLLVPFAASGPWAALLAARWLGAGAWFLTAAYLGLRFAALGTRAVVVGVLALLATVPLAAWAVAGMETGLVTALATLSLARGFLARLSLGLCAALRPELLPWALTVTLGDALVGSESTAKRLRSAVSALALALGPFVVVALLRDLLFGAAYPLSLLAKPSDLSSGLRYALGGLLLSGPFWLLAAGPAFGRLSGRGRVQAVAALVHVFALALAGGDWMSLYRLFVPVLPSVILVGAELAQRSSRFASGVRLALALGASAVLAISLGPSARGVLAQRRELIEGAGPLLAGARRVAALDVGWVGAATAATIVDLAGVTDPTVARLAGGHTSKRLPDSFLEAREVDAVVLLAEAPTFAPLSEQRFPRIVERRVPTLASAELFRVVGILPLRGTRQHYLVARRDPR
ncbi:MAG TPA: hypothetical protein VG937_21690 [Polyangiaceae bacterium]|nr:hypothetical protein [Polyangiaceae bacterium]